MTHTPIRPSEPLVDQTRVHRDACADTHDAYTSFHGWVLTCLWCPATATGATKREALVGMQQHYDQFGLKVHA